MSNVAVLDGLARLAAKVALIAKNQTHTILSAFLCIQAIVWLTVSSAEARVGQERRIVALSRKLALTSMSTILAVLTMLPNATLVPAALGTMSSALAVRPGAQEISAVLEVSLFHVLQPRRTIRAASHTSKYSIALMAREGKGYICPNATTPFKCSFLYA